MINNDDIMINLSLSTTEVDEILNGLRTHSKEIDALTQRILAEGQAQYAALIEKQQSDAAKAIKDKEKDEKEKKQD